ncbi:recombinase family protein [Microvirga sp. 3-52]|uniref:recombinase family protein n=1 Tax=Microvirga sp. 3-52 TaxID=2792425 RepID=UPI001AD3C3EF|nr:recombinase family protein [Microvirga sp. 3-52]MBO1905629.1 recombinase family protein [Microvirga sp. 3-52]MBS7452645.1 recombinase family protein [Microvirga sp. 3-52]
MLIGYARVSTDGQDLTTQRDALLQAGCQRIYEEKVSGAVSGRVELARLLDHLRPGDVVVVMRLDRLARSTRNLLDIAEQLQLTKAGLRSISEPWADTTSPAGRMILTIFAGIAEFERDLIKARTADGRARARSLGTRFGRPPKLTLEKLTLAGRLISEGTPARQVASLLGVHPVTLYRRLPTSASS